MKKIALALALLGLSVTTFAAKEPRTLAYTCTATQTTVGIRDENGRLQQYRSSKMPVFHLYWNHKSRKFFVDKGDVYLLGPHLQTRNYIDGIKSDVYVTNSEYSSFVMDKKALTFAWTDIQAQGLSYLDETAMVFGTCEKINHIAGSKF